MHSGGGSGLANFFTQGSHHRNLTVIYIVQDLFHQSRVMRTVSLNSHYLVLFKNPRDKLQIRNLVTQMHSNDAKFLVQETGRLARVGTVHVAAYSTRRVAAAA
jgi:hypothetical protein